tara:strand:+ start:5661 stop:5894 length:234 start_codon:yes stop_codon:yes gene_type:complete
MDNEKKAHLYNFVKNLEDIVDDRDYSKENKKDELFSLVKSYIKNKDVINPYERRKKVPDKEWRINKSMFSRVLKVKE